MSFSDITTEIRDYNDAELLRYLESPGAVLKVKRSCENYNHPCDGTPLMLALELDKSVEVVLKLIEIGGWKLVVMRDKEYGRTALHYACMKRNMSIDVISKLIEEGGSKLVKAKDRDVDRIALHYACMNPNLSIEIVSKLIEMDKPKSVFEKHPLGRTTRDYVFGNPITLKLIELGTPKSFMVQDRYGKTALHEVCSNQNVSIGVVTKLIEVGGQKLVQLKEKQSNATALHYACQNENASIDIISKLMEVYGPNLVKMKQKNDRTALHLACKNTNMSVDVVKKLIDMGGPELVMMRVYSGTALHCACMNENIMSSIQIVSKLIEVGGPKLLAVKNSFDETALHKACKNPAMSIDIISKLIEIGGPELVKIQNIRGRTALHEVCENPNMSIDIVAKLTEVGGLELVMLKDLIGTSLLHACKNPNFSVDVISKLIEVGGSELVNVKNKNGKTALHWMCGNSRVSIDIISKLIEVGGREMVMVMDQKYGRSALHVACKNPNMSIEIVSKLIEVGGPELVKMEDKNGDTALHHGFFYDENLYHQPNYNDVFSLLVQESILTNIGGEFGIGGLFNVARKKVQNRIYGKWEELSPALKSALETLQGQQYPILHAAILAESPLHVIQNIINWFEYSVSKVDSLDRYPIEVAFEEGVSSDNGLQEIVKATSKLQLQHPRIIHLAAQHGLQWRHHMKELAEANADEIVHGFNGLTGLRLFMVAAMGDSYDLSTIYGMMKMGPEMDTMRTE